jgi:hypothetical protein
MMKALALVSLFAGCMIDQAPDVGEPLIGL